MTDVIPNKHQKAYYQRHKETVKRKMTDKYLKAIADETYKCNTHNMIFRSASRLREHMNIKSHKPERYTKYGCGLCSYNTKLKSHYNRHLRTVKHRRNSDSASSEEDS